MAIAELQRKRPRKQAKPVRRGQLINATIDCLAKLGYSGTTLADVAERAGMSRGIVNFHFDSKEKLLIETLRYMSEEYAAAWNGALANAGDDPAQKLWALVEVDFQPEVCNRRKVAAWCAFWGEAKSRPTYQELCGARDQHYQDQMEEICAELEEQGAYGRDPAKMALGIDSLLEGLWMRLLFMGREGARETLYACAVEQLASLYPRHFDRQGVIWS